MFCIKNDFRPLLLGLQAAFGLCLILTTPSGVRGAENYGDIPEVVVEAYRPSLTVPSYEDATRQAHKVTGGAAVVDAENTKKGRASTLHDSLSMTPGVFVQPRQGSEEARLSIRGSGLQRTFHGRGIKLLQDGVPLNLADGGFDFQAVEPLSARYIEVFRGANALEYGAASLGGAINYVSRTGHDSSPFQARFEGGSFNYFRGQLSSGRVIGKTDYYGSVSEFYQTGFRDHARQNTQRFFGNVGYKLSPHVENRTTLTYVRTDSQLPGSLTNAEMKNRPEMANVPNAANNWKRDFNLFRVSNKTTFAKNQHRIDVNGFYSWKQLDHPIFVVIDQLSHDVGVSAKYSNSAEFMGRKNSLVAGVAPAMGLVRDRRFVNVSGARGTQTADSDQTSTNIDVYAENQHYVSPKVALALGAQVGYAIRKNEDNIPATMSDPDNSDEQTFSGFSPKVGFRYEINRQSQVFANVSRSFEPPSFGELVGNNISGGLVELNEQTATTYEVGVRGRQHHASWDLSLYHALVKDELLSLTDALGNPLGTVNTNKTIHRGIEAGLNLVVWRGLEKNQVVFQQAYTLNHFTFDNDPVFGDKTLAGIPKHFYRAELQVEHSTGFYGGPNVEWVPSKYPIDHENTFYADPYTLVGFKAGYKTRQGLSLFIDARNVADKTYAATTGVIANANGADSRQFLPGDGRSFFGGIEWNF
jgi:iron complex outermembrane recepter protein